MDDLERATGLEPFDMAHDAPYQRIYTMLTVAGVVAIVIGLVGLLNIVRALAVDDVNDANGALLIDGGLYVGGAIVGYIVLWIFATFVATQREILAHLKRHD